MITKIKGTCQYEGCDELATYIASGRYYMGVAGHGTSCFCEDHAAVVADEGNPEYVVCCPNCDCKFGVN